MKARYFCAVLFSGLFFLAFSASPAMGQALTWWVEYASQKVLQDRPPQPVNEVTLESARNEYEPFQVVLRADGEDLFNVDARMSDLVGPDGAVIPSGNVNLYRAWYVMVTEPSGQGGQGDGVERNPRDPGEYPDPLIPFFDPYDPRHFAVGTPFYVLENRLQPIFGDIYVPADIPAGVYEGTLRVTVGFVEAAEVPVTLRVFDFTLPFERRVATAYGLRPDSIRWYHGGTEDELLEITNNYVEILHRFRLDLTNIISGGAPQFTFDPEGNLEEPDYSAYDAQLETHFSGTRYDDGVGATIVNTQLLGPGGGRSISDDKYIQIAADLARHLKEKGWWERVFVYVRDEPWLFPGAFERIAYDVALLKMADPDWVTRMMATNHWVKEMQYSIGIWCPLTGNYDHWNWSGPEYGREDYQRLIAEGARLWFYVCNATFPPYAGYDIDTVWGHEPRILQWGSWYEGATGFLYWSTNYWVKDDPWGTLLNLVQFAWAARTGDGFLVYPGNHDGTATGAGSPTEIAIDGPVITHRLMMIREGMEDWDYFLLAEDLGGKSFAREQVESVYTQFGINPVLYDPENPPWSYDGSKLYEARRNLGEWIEAGGSTATEKQLEKQDDGGGGCAYSSPGVSSGVSLAIIICLLLGAASPLLRRFGQVCRGAARGAPTGPKLKHGVR